MFEIEPSDGELPTPRCIDCDDPLNDEEVIYYGCRCELCEREAWAALAR